MKHVILGLVILLMLAGVALFFVYDIIFVNMENAKKLDALGKTGKQIKVASENYPDNKVKSFFSVLKKSPEIKIGLYTEFYQNGQKKRQCSFEENIANGPLIYWSETGTVLLKGTLKDGKRQGKFTEWHANGQKKLVCNYENGELTGLYNEYYDLKYSPTMLKIEYKNGKQDGSYIYFAPDGKVLTQKTFVNGQATSTSSPDNEKRPPSKHKSKNK
jgi:antitoxin component YwqK of YwqJK toxin-antitoxin module